MALAARGNGSGFFLTLTMIDTQGDTSTKRFELRGADFAAAQVNATAIIAAIQGVSASVVGSSSLSFVQDEDTFAYPAGADNSVRARITFQLADSVEKATRDIPAPVDAIFVGLSGPTMNVVNIGDPLMATYAQLFQAGGHAFISDGEDSDFTLRGKRTTK